AANDFRLAITIYVGKAGRFVIDHVEDKVALPMAFAALRVFVPGSILAGKTINQNICPSILIEIVGESEKVFRISVVRPEPSFVTRNDYFGPIALLALEGGIGGIELMTLFEVRSLVPEGTGNDIHYPIAIEIAEVGALGPKLIAELYFFERVNNVLGRNESWSQPQSGHGEENPEQVLNPIFSYHSFSLLSSPP